MHTPAHGVGWEHAHGVQREPERAPVAGWEHDHRSCSSRNQASHSGESTTYLESWRRFAGSWACQRLIDLEKTGAAARQDGRHKHPIRAKVPSVWQVRVGPQRRGHVPVALAHLHVDVGPQPRHGGKQQD